MVSDLHRFLSRIGSVIPDYSYRTEIEEEILDHLECAASHWEEQGMDPVEARRRAIAEFGDPEGIGRMLQQTERGGRAMRMVRLAGFCALAGGTLAMFMFRETDITWKLRSYVQQILPGDRYGTSLMLLCVFLFTIGLVGFHLHHAQKRSDRIALLISPVAGPGLFLLGLLGLGWNAMMAGMMMTGLGLSLAGGYLAFRQEQPVKGLGHLMISTGALPLLFPFLGQYAAERPIGAFVTYAFSSGWILLGLVLPLGLGRGVGTNQRAI